MLHTIERQLAVIIEQVALLGIRELNGTARQARQSVKILIGELARVCGSSLYNQQEKSEEL
jgi:hypothetical protein